MLHKNYIFDITNRIDKLILEFEGLNSDGYINDKMYKDAESSLQNIFDHLK